MSGPGMEAHPTRRVILCTVVALQPWRHVFARNMARPCLCRFRVPRCTADTAGCQRALIVPCPNFAHNASCRTAASPSHMDSRVGHTELTHDSKGAAGRGHTHHHKTRPPQCVIVHGLEFACVSAQSMHVGVGPERRPSHKLSVKHIPTRCINMRICQGPCVRLS